MRIHLLQHAVLGAVLAGMLATASALEHEAIKRAFDVPPSADLAYSVKARQKGFTLNGDALTIWRAGGGKYLLSIDTHAGLFGKILENRSEGAIDTYGIAPVQFYEKRFRKPPSTTTFDRGGKTISFTDGKLTYPIKGGEQDRSSAAWQLVAVARGAPEKFTPGSQWTFFVAGQRDAEPWTFKVINRETVRTGMGEVEAVHLSKLPPPDAKDRQIDIWLAPAHEWYPVRVRFADDDGEFVEQTLEKITRK
jgi:Protein of unknown function (DUF3108)